MKPWSAEHAAGKISRPLRHNGTPYSGMNIFLLWGAAMAKGYAAPIWMTSKQAVELGAFVRNGEHGSLVVYANSVTRTETNDKGEDIEREIPFMKGYTVFNVEQIEGLPALREAGKPASIVGAHRERRPLSDRNRSHDLPRREQRILCAGTRHRADAPPSKLSGTRRAITRLRCTS